MRTKMRVCVAACLAFAAQGCADSHAEEDSAEPSEVGESKGNLSTDDLLDRAAALGSTTLVVFDFDDTLYDHRDGGSSKWARFAEASVRKLAARRPRLQLGVCSKNTNRNRDINRALQGLNSGVFNGAFFASPAFQDNSDSPTPGKSDDIREIMRSFGIGRGSQVIFFDDDRRNIESVTQGIPGVIAINVHSNGLDESEFRDGLNKRLQELGTPVRPASSGSTRPTNAGATSAGGSSTSISGRGNLRVNVGGKWLSVGCSGSSPKADGSCVRWSIVDRKLRNQNGVYLHCSEGWNRDGQACECHSGDGEAYHANAEKDFGANNRTRTEGNALITRMANESIMRIFPNNGHEFCLAVAGGTIVNRASRGGGNHEESVHAMCNTWCIDGGCP